MKVVDTLKIVDAGWIRKYKSFRVKFQRREEGRLVTEYSPGLEEESKLMSEVSTRRLAWKLWQATRELAKGEDGELVNLVVVDENNEPIKSYVTGKVEIFNPCEEDDPEVETASEEPTDGA